MILVDTTVWIDFFRGKNTKQTQFFETALQHKQEIFLCGVILTEILQGIQSDKEYQVVTQTLEPFVYLDMTRETYMTAADIFRKLRKRGITVRKTIDCMIASVAIENNLLLLHHDKDFHPMEQYCGLTCL